MLLSDWWACQDFAKGLLLMYAWASLLKQSVCAVLKLWSECEWKLLESMTTAKLLKVLR